MSGSHRETNEKPKWQASSCQEKKGGRSSKIFGRLENLHWLQKSEQNKRSLEQLQETVLLAHKKMENNYGQGKLCFKNQHLRKQKKKKNSNLQKKKNSELSVARVKGMKPKSCRSRR
uniref:uncharacterized protein LOC117605536 n=1 Tax=Osmia lignaria TaxID=473952 RepID=UPI001479837F|nr:uncharacterized protein LOC117605536 [Osmia lignaria]